ncbi:MAG: hypothetical protein RQ745_11060 [Longimicrobiales bacterium]|nr:hypothetical protein [Longimicrobiales bacterium]
MATDGVKHEVVTDTGWRIKGALAESIEGGRASVQPLEEALWGGTFRVQTLGRHDPAALIIEALEGWLSEIHDAPVDLSEERVIPGGKCSGFYWNPDRRGGVLLARHPHPAFAKRACITQLWLSTSAAQTKLRIRVGPEDGADAIRGRVGVGQLVPPWMTALMDRAHYSWNGGQSRIVKLENSEIPGLVDDELCDPARTTPIAILSPTEEGDYMVDPEVLARELLGIAQLHVITDHSHTFTLSDTIRDRHLSAFWGALRIYLPGFTKADHPHSHPLLLSDRLTDPLMRASEFGAVLMQRAPVELDLPLPASFERERALIEAEAEARAAAEALERAQAEANAEAAAEDARAAEVAEGADTGETTAASTNGTSDAATGAPAATPQPTLHLPDRFVRLVENQLTLLTDLRDEVKAQREQLDAVAGTVHGVQEEIEQLRTRMKLGGTDVGQIGRQLDRATSLIRRLLPAEEDADLNEGAQTGEKVESHEILDIVRRARAEYVDDLFVLDSAEASAKESHYEDPGTVETILGVMAEISRQRQIGELGRGLKSAFGDYGLTYHSGIAKSSSERIRRQHEFTDDAGRVHICEEHISVGNSYDSRYCLRVYFTSKSPKEHRFVVGHVGRHLETMSTT